MAAQVRLLIELANAQAAAAAAAPAVVPPPIPANVTVTLYPGAATATPLNYELAADWKIFKGAVAPLLVQFDMTSDHLQSFLQKVKMRAQIYNWGPILTTPDDDGIDRNLINQYGILTLANCVAKAITIAHPITRATQDSIMMSIFLQDSLTDEARNLIMASPEAFTVGGHPSGPCLLKVIIGKATIDTYATIDVLRKAVSKLDEKMVELNSDIKAFNLYVTQLKNSLVARGQSVPELQMHLFEGYAKTADEDFVRYMRNKRDDHEDGSHRLSIEALMLLAINKYDLKVQNKTWSVADTKDTRIIALEAAIQKITENKGSLPKAKNATTYSADDKRFAWKLVPPKAGDKQNKMWNKKKYFWCPTHNAWTLHTPESCNLNAKPEQAKKTVTEPTPPSPAASTLDKQKLFLSQALQAISEIQEGSDDES